jgi:PAS domain S-box-containing protein
LGVGGMRAEQSGIFKAFARAADGAMIADSHGRVLLWNRAAERLLGWTANEAVGRPCCEVLGGRPVNGRRASHQGCQVMAAARQGEGVEAFDLRAQSKTGREVTLNVSTLAIPLEGNGSGLIVHLFREVAARPVAPPPAGAEAALQPAQTNGTSPLTPRELEVLRLLATGANTKSAADKLGVSPATIRNHVQNLLGKLGVHSRLQAVAYATSHGLL